MLPENIFLSEHKAALCGFNSSVTDVLSYSHWSAVTGSSDAFPFSDVPQGWRGRPLLSSQLYQCYLWLFHYKASNMCDITAIKGLTWILRHTVGQHFCCVVGRPKLQFHRTKISLLICVTKEIWVGGFGRVLLSWKNTAEVSSLITAAASNSHMSGGILVGTECEWVWCVSEIPTVN